MSEYFNIYEDIDQINIAELKRAAGLKDPDKVVWPKGKKYKVQLAGKECTVTTSFANAEGKTNGYQLLDAYSALSTMMTRDEVVDMIHKQDPNGHTDADLYATAEFLPGLPKLTDKEVEQRRAFTAAILTLLSDQKTIEVLAECAPRKKNGLFAKGRVFKIGLTGLAESYNSELIEIVGKSKDETKLTVSILGRNTSPDELDAWKHDFISTYHEGLPISEALKKVLKATKSGSESHNEKSKTTDSVLLKKPSKHIKDSDQSGAVLEIKEVSEEENQEKVKLIDTLKNEIKHINTIDCEGKIFTFDGTEYFAPDFRHIEPGLKFFYSSNDPNNPNIKEVLEKGGQVSNRLTGKTDYYVVDLNSKYVFGDNKVKSAVEQLSKRDTLTVITLDNLLEVLDR